MKRALMIGAGGWARFKWVREILPAFSDRVAVAGLVDIDQDVLQESGEALGVPAENRFTRMEKAFAEVDADFCIISVPPDHHKQVALLAADRGMDIISEKPIADRRDDAVAICEAVARNEVKMAVTQNYRFEAPILTMKHILHSGELGRLNYIVARYAHDYRQPGSWRVGRVHESDHPLLVEASIHHFDMLRNLSGSNCETMMGYGWNPEWSSFQGVCAAIFIMRMENGTRAVYEGNSLGAGQINPWFHEAYRVECEKGAVAVDRDQTVRIYRRDEAGVELIEEVAAIDVPLAGHHALLTDFLAWLDGGKPVETQLSDNIHSAAMLFAAVDAVADGQAKTVSDYVPG